ncbi:MAG: hypothetical protein EXQ77_05565 [Thermoleophilia bacterium]|nr:hypothetical protein [Thermoleophilia bacterium]
MGVDRATSFLEHAKELERRDSAVAAALAEIHALIERVGVVRRAATAIRAELEALPAERVRLRQMEALAREELGLARWVANDLDRRVAQLERQRRVRQGDLDQAQREHARAREAVNDAEAVIDRMAARSAALDRRLRALRSDAAALVHEAASLAARLREAPRVSDAGKGEPGKTLDGLEEWGGRARAALFVARGALERERERIVAEANALAEGALGEPLGATSVTLVRRRLEAAFIPA